MGYEFDSLELERVMPYTNAFKVRNMPDELLAEFLGNVEEGKYECNGMSWLEWLRKDVVI